MNISIKVKKYITAFCNDVLAFNLIIKNLIWRAC